MIDYPLTREVDNFILASNLFTAHPKQGSPWIYLVRLFAFLIILGAILRKNSAKK